MMPPRSWCPSSQIGNPPIFFIQHSIQWQCLWVEPENLFADSRTQVDAWTADDNVIRVDADDDALLADDADVDGGDAEAAVSEMHHDEVAVYYGDDNGVKAGLPGK
mmetsp:Transcript_24625/g.44228  ORF Transcript_24625/g.44228 Transcript_24625/m.44228 type:complete len:106 (-) Transcript_24625:385-702(-)